MVDAFIALASPVGIVVLVITGAGIYLAVLVALGGIGERNFNKVSKIVFGILSTIMIVFGLLGIFAVIYPVLRQNLPSIPTGFFATLLVILLLIVLLLLLVIGTRKIIVYFKNKTRIKQSIKSVGPNEEINWVSVVYENRNIWGDHVATYAAIRIDNRSTPQDLNAHLVKVTRNNTDLPIDTINPTGNELRWVQEGNKCILQIVEERIESAYFIFKNRRESDQLPFGEYIIELKISDKLSEKTMGITKSLKIKKPHHFHGTHETGLEWK